MKKFRKVIFATGLLLITLALSAQSPPHPNGGNAPGSGSTPVGGGAPISGGVLILMILSAGYGAKHIFDIRKKAIEKI